jgi:ribosomal protein S18 acetylase RimI-like enzyme
MQLLNLTDKLLAKKRRPLIHFFHLHGDHRITKDAFDWIQKVKGEDLDQEGTLILCAVEQNKLIGVVIASNYGIHESFIAVHKKYRNQHTAQKMVKHTIQHLGKLYGRVAMDNTPSLKVCLDNQMVAFHLFTGPTKKPTLWLGGGNWSKEDILT